MAMNKCKPAYPTNGEDEGMSLREYYAGEVMFRLVSGSRAHLYTSRKEMAEESVKMADALLLELGKEQ